MNLDNYRRYFKIHRVDTLEEVQDPVTGIVTQTKTSRNVSGYLWRKSSVTNHTDNGFSRPTETAVLFVDPFVYLRKGDIVDSIYNVSGIDTHGSHNEIFLFQRDSGGSTTIGGY